MAGIRILRAGREELDEDVPLFDGYRQFYGQRTDLVASCAFLRARIERDESVIFVAYTNPGEAAGFTQLYPSFSSVSLKPLWILNDLFVRSDVRHGGVGRALLERARQHALETGAKGLVLSTGVANKSAQILYESCGWQRDDSIASTRTCANYKGRKRSMAAENSVIAPERTLVTTRVFDASPERVYKAWTDPKQLARWFPPGGIQRPGLRARRSCRWRHAHRHEGTRGRAVQGAALPRPWRLSRGCSEQEAHWTSAATSNWREHVSSTPPASHTLDFA